MAFVIDSATISTTEYSLPADTTTGVPTAQTDDVDIQPWIQIAAMAAGGADVFRVNLYEKVNGQTAAIVATWYIIDSKPWVMPCMRLGEGWDLTVTKVQGTDRVVHWSLRKVTIT